MNYQIKFGEIKMGNNFLKIDANNNDEGNNFQKDDYKNKEKNKFSKSWLQK